jgi:hypothetical protein
VGFVSLSLLKRRHGGLLAGGVEAAKADAEVDPTLLSS